MRDFIERNTMTIVCTFFGLMLSSLIISGCYDAPINGDFIDCYDLNSNRIEGQTCIVENGFNDKNLAIFSFSIASLFLVIALFFIGKSIDHSLVWSSNR